MWSVDYNSTLRVCFKETEKGIRFDILIQLFTPQLIDPCNVLISWVESIERGGEGERRDHLE